MKSFSVIKQSLICGSAVAILFSGCAKKQDSTNPAGQVPKSLAFSAPAEGPILTQAQVRRIKATFKNKSVMALPPGDLIFSGHDRSPEEVDAETAVLQQTDANSYAMLKDIQADCTQGRPTLSFNATFPSENGVSPADLKAGDNFSYLFDLGLSGSTCPVEFSANGGASAEVAWKDASAANGLATGKASGKTTFMIKNEKYAKLLGAKGISVDSSVSTIYVLHDTAGKQLTTFAASGTFYSLTENVGYSANFEMQSHSPAPDCQADCNPQESISTVSLDYGDFKVSLIDHSIQDKDGNLTSQFTYLNGRLVSPADLQKMFSDNSPENILSSQPSISALTKM